MNRNNFVYIHFLIPTLKIVIDEDDSAQIDVYKDSFLIFPIFAPNLR